MTWRPPRYVAVALLVVPLVAAGCGGGDDEPSAPAAKGEVSVVDNRFEPDTIEVAIGDTVTWVFKGSVKHNVVGPGFTSETQKDGTFERTFNSAGTVQYVCTIHPGMKGKIEVS
jgi:plastocyanin